MTQYTMRCPQQDGTQHFDCVPVENPLLGQWRHVPTEAEGITAATPDLSNLTQRERNDQIHRMSSVGFRPRRCHWDKIDPNNVRPNWPDHSTEDGHIRTADWTGRTEAYPDIKRLYRCSVHHCAPDKIWIRPPWNWDHEFQRIIATKFRQVRGQRTQAQINAIAGATYALGWVPYYIQHYEFFVLNRPPPVTSHDRW